MDTDGFIELADEFLNGETPYDPGNEEHASQYAEEIAESLKFSLRVYLHERIQAGDYVKHQEPE